MASLLSRVVATSATKVPRVSLIPVAYGHVKPIRYPQVSYNDMTRPEGSWQRKYDQMNAEYSKYMYIGILSLIVSTTITLYSLDLTKYMEPPHRNTPEGLAFLNPDPKILEDIQRTA